MRPYNLDTAGASAHDLELIARARRLHIWTEIDVLADEADSPRGREALLELARVQRLHEEARFTVYNN